MPNFKCNEFFLDQKVQSIFAGSRSAFAFSDLTGNSLTEFIKEFNDANQQGGAPVPKGMIEIELSDNEKLLVSRVTWECYFPAELRRLHIPRKTAVFLFKLLQCELTDHTVTDWVKKQLNQMFGGNLTEFENTIKMIDTWLELAPAEGFDAEAIEIVKSYTRMLSDRLASMHFSDESNGELYRVMHVNKNVIQREILNPQAQQFVYPMPVAEQQEQPDQQQPAQ